MKKKSLAMALMLLFVCLTTAGAQVLNVESGVAFAKASYNKAFHPFYISAGLDYLDRGWFNLSSMVGVSRHGYKNDIVVNDVGGNFVEFNNVRSGTYLTLTTLFDVKKTTVDGFTLYAGVGPRLDIKVGDGVSDVNSQEEEMLREAEPFTPVLFGLRCEVGVKKRFNNIEVGVVGSYQPTFTHLVKNNSLFKERSFTLGITLGYALANDN